MFRKYFSLSLGSYHKNVTPLHVTLIRFATTASFSSSNPAELKPMRITENMSFRPALHSPLDDHERPIVLLYSWLVAKAKHIYKYGDFYLGKGFDVLHVKVKPDQLLRPKRAQEVVKTVLNFVNEGNRSEQPVLQHGFSVGGYLYGETLVQILTNDQKYGTVGKRICGQIFDSPVSMRQIPYGTSRALTDNRFLQNVVETSLDAYLKVFYNYTSKHYLKAQDAFVRNELGVPSLFLYSESDVVAEAKTIQEVSSGMRQKGTHVVTKSFAGSPHIRHFHLHPEEYIQILNAFLTDIGLAKSQHRDTIDILMKNKM